jgi:hypothetical protein
MIIEGGGLLGAYRIGVRESAAIDRRSPNYRNARWQSDAEKHARRPATVVRHAPKPIHPLKIKSGV